MIHGQSNSLRVHHDHRTPRFTRGRYRGSSNSRASQLGYPAGVRGSRYNGTLVEFCFSMQDHRARPRDVLPILRETCRGSHGVS